MIAIKNFKMPSCCGDCNFTICKGKDEPWNYCCAIDLQDVFLDAADKPNNCPLIDIEPLTDSEQRIFLSAISREGKICKEIDDENSLQNVFLESDKTAKMLTPIVDSIERKVKKILWH